jgi:hypothetical protein
MIHVVCPPVDKNPCIIHIRYCTNPNCLFCQRLRAYFLEQADLLNKHKIAVVHRITSCADHEKIFAISYSNHTVLKQIRTIEEMHAQIIVPLTIS